MSDLTRPGLVARNAVVTAAAHGGLDHLGDTLCAGIVAVRDALSDRGGLLREAATMTDLDGTVHSANDPDYIARQAVLNYVITYGGGNHPRALADALDMVDTDLLNVPFDELLTEALDRATAPAQD